MAKLVYMYYNDAALLHWFRLRLLQECPIEYFDPTTTYSTDTVFYYDMYGPCHEHIVQQLAQGQRVIFDAKNEHYVHDHRQWVMDAFLAHPGQGMFLISGDSAIDIPGVAIVATPYWYWITDQPNFAMFGLDQFVPLPNPVYQFFMNINLCRPDRDYLYNALGNLVNNSIHSYRARGRMLPNDSDHPGWQRYVNTDWINSTGFTLTVETFIDDQSSSGYSLTHNNNFLTEKSYKPIAAQHPFIMASTAGNLANLRSQGFETFPELFDESYDDIADWRARMNRIVEIVRDFDLGSLNQVRVREKIRHNHARFFNTALTEHLCATTIINPILEFIHV
jgi:hypothetical protein